MRISWLTIAVLLFGFAILGSTRVSADDTLTEGVDNSYLRGLEGDDDDDLVDMESSAESGSDTTAAAGSVNKDEAAVIDPKGKEKASGYVAPSAPNAIFVEDFQSSPLEDRWTYSAVPQYNGRFAVGQGANPAFPGDRGLIIPHKARHYALTTPVIVDDLDKKDLVVQYEVRLDDGMTCGGAYLKLLTDGEFGYSTGASFDNNVIYSVMFGPDRCGATDKVHFIFQSRNPVTGRITEHHLKNPPHVAGVYDKKTHHYSLMVKADDGTVEVAVDGEVKTTGNLSEDFEPPFQPPKQIPDKDDKKPNDWVDQQKIPDPEAVKPEDWDEDAPSTIPDESASLPDGWLTDEPKQIADPKATEPEDWDEEEDGKWEAPLIANPKCNVGCGEWTPPSIPNPAFKGKWRAPMIDNPKYIGEWAPRNIDNPDFYEAGKPSLLPIRALGFEIWTMDQGVVFDNIYVGHDVVAAKSFADETYGKKKVVELEAEEKATADSKKGDQKKGPGAASTSATIERLEAFLNIVEAGLAPLEQALAKVGAEPVLDKLIDIGINRPLITIVTVPIFIVTLMLMLLSGGGKKEPSTAQTTSVAAKKKTDAVERDDSADTGEDSIREVASEGRDESTGLRSRRRPTAE